MSYLRQADALIRQLEIVPFRAHLAKLAPHVDLDLWPAVIEEAARIAENVIAPIDASLDTIGATLVDRRVKTAPGHREAWNQFVHGGWLTMAVDEASGGQGLPLALLSACEELFNRASAAFMMLPTATRCGAHLLETAAMPEVSARWVPKLLAGEWTATICISEPDAGSDVGRIRTRAVRDTDHNWRVTGQKCWISYGDHDLSDRIGHLMLARTSDVAGVQGLSLFLVPNLRDDRDANGVDVQRIEHKMGLHGSPTCVLGFDEAEAILLGAEGQGLRQMFQMMAEMRLSCGPQGTGLAAGAYETALSYASERRQGGPANDPAVPIIAHVDVQRQLLSMAGRVETLRALNLTAAMAMNLADLAVLPDERETWSALAQFLLPLVKDAAARGAFAIASDAIQVLGGAGYTREWPVERWTRDARVFAVFEGTSGIQAIDLLHRRVWRGGGKGIDIFLSLATDDARLAPEGAELIETLGLLKDCTVALAGMKDRVPDAEAGATAFLELCALAAMGWMAIRIVALGGEDPVAARMQAAARFYLAELPGRAKSLAELSLLGGSRLDGFSALIA